MNYELEVSAAPAQAADSAACYAKGLSLLVADIDDVSAAVLVIGNANVGPFSPAAFWPHGKPCGDDAVLWLVVVAGRNATCLHEPGR